MLQLWVVSVHLDIPPGYNKRDLQGATYVKVGIFSFLPSLLETASTGSTPAQFLLWVANGACTPQEELPAPLENVQTEDHLRARSLGVSCSARLQLDNAAAALGRQQQPTAAPTGHSQSAAGGTSKNMLPAAGRPCRRLPNLPSFFS